MVIMQYSLSTSKFINEITQITISSFGESLGIISMKTISPSRNLSTFPSEIRAEIYLKASDFDNRTTVVRVASKRTALPKVVRSYIPALVLRRHSNIMLGKGFSSYFSIH